MQTLAQLQARMIGADAVEAMAAATELTNYFLVYNEEYNTLIMKRQQAESALFVAAHNPAGVDHAEVLRLQGLVLGIESRMKVQDAKMLAFQASTLAITGPDAPLVAQVKQLTAQVAVMIATGEAIKNIMVGLGQIAALVDQVQGGA
jgi:beta-lactamase regulating signal transducer with metallopeptidase domain